MKNKSMESIDNSPEDCLCDSLNKSVNMDDNGDGLITKTTTTKQKRPDREFYVPPSAHNSSKSKLNSNNNIKKKTVKQSNNKLTKTSGQAKGNQTASNNQTITTSSSTTATTTTTASTTVTTTKLTTNNGTMERKKVENYQIQSTNDAHERKEKEQKEADEKTEQKENQSKEIEPSKKMKNSNDNEPSWDEIYDDDGDCVKPDLAQSFCSDRVDYNERNEANRRKDKPNLGYLKFDGVYESTAHDDDVKLSHVLEIYDFPSDLRTQDLVTSLSVFNSRDFDIKWVDDTHALAVFSSQSAAKEAMSMPYSNIRLRPLSEGIKESKIKAQKCAEYLLPYKQRPQTSAILARRLVTGALGLRSNISPEQRAAERKRLQEAKEKRRMAIKQTNDVWEGNVG